MLLFSKIFSKFHTNLKIFYIHKSYVSSQIFLELIWSYSIASPKLLQRSQKSHWNFKKKILIASAKWLPSMAVNTVSMSV